MGTVLFLATTELVGVEISFHRSLVSARPYCVHTDSTVFVDMVKSSGKRRREGEAREEEVVVKFYQPINQKSQGKSVSLICLIWRKKIKKKQAALLFLKKM